MPWKETCAVDQRTLFIAEYVKDELSVAELCRRFEISRKTGHKWIVRFAEGSWDGLKDRSHRPHHHPWTTPPGIVDSIIAAKKAFPSLGPKKVKELFERHNPDAKVPAASTIGRILKQFGWVTPRKQRRRRPSPATQPFGECDRPNALWCADFKGHFQTGRVRCHPLTLIDAHSRYLLRCEALRRPRTRETRVVMLSAFEQFGLPDAIRTDNGPPFASNGPGGLTRLSVWWVKLGIRLERIEPGQPQQNGRQERFHLTLQQDTASPPCESLPAQQRSFGQFRAFYNDIRPHEALGQATPAEVYCTSDRVLPKRVPDPEYPSHFETVLVASKGVASWRGRDIYVGAALANEVVGFEAIGDGTWAVYFSFVELGCFHRPRARGGLIRLKPTPNN